MDRDKKILIITHYSGVYGANVSLVEYLANTAIPLSNFLVIIPCKGAFEEILKSLNISYEIHWFQFSASHLSMPFLERKKLAFIRIKKIFTLANLLKRHHPTVLYSNSSVIHYGFFIAKLLHVPHVWHLREFGEKDYQFLPDFGYTFQKFLLSLNTHNIAISKIIAKHYGLNKKNSSIIYNGVIRQGDLLNSKSLAELLYPLDFGVVGLITSYKNQLKIIEAFHAFFNIGNRESKLYIIGEGIGEYFDQIVSYIQTNSLSNNIILTGHIANRDKIYNLFDVLIVGAKNEGFGRTTAEAMAYGKIPVGLNSGGTKEVIEDKVTGLLFNTFDELPEIMRHLVDDKEYTKKLRKSMILNFKEEFTTDFYSRKIDEIISRI